LAFRAALTEADALRNSLISWAHTLPFLGWLFPVGLTMIGAGIAVAITRRYAPEAAGSGIPHLEAVLHRYRNLEWKRVLPVKFFAGIIAIGSGLALGREGPTVQMGGSIGDGVSRILKVSEHERLTLISAGAGAGLAAAFNAPLAGLIFVLEEVRRISNRSCLVLLLWRPLLRISLLELVQASFRYLLFPVTACLHYLLYDFCIARDYGWFVGCAF